MIRKREGFTLVELLVVIAIIIILAAILFPVFAKAREKAQQSRCINNFKQLSVAIAMYEDDYEGGILPVSITNNNAGSSEALAGAWGSYWQDLVNPYVKQLKKGAKGGQAGGQGELFQCPSAPKETATNANMWQMGKDYGYNPYLKKDVSQTMVKYPSLTLRLTEVGSYRFDPHNLPATETDALYMGGSWYGPLPNGQVSGIGYSLNLYAPGWHNGYNDCLWFDGHVSSITWERVMYTDREQNTTDPNVWCRLSPKAGGTAEG